MPAGSSWPGDPKWRIPGQMSPGAMQFDRTPSGPPSTASIFDSMITAAFDTEYAPMPGSPITPASEATWTMHPRRAARCGYAAFAYRK